MSTPTPPPPQPIGAPSGFHPPTHGNWAQWASVIIASIALVASMATLCFTVYFHNAERAAKSTDEHTNALIGDKLTPAMMEIKEEIDKKLDPMSGKLNDFGNRISRLEGRFEELDSGQKHLTKFQLNKLSDQLSVARAAQKQMNVDALISLGKDVAAFSKSQDPEIAQLAWRTTLELVDYRSFLNASFAPPHSDFKPPDHFEYRLTVKVIPGVPIPAGGASFGALRSPNFVPASEAARIDIINGPPPMSPPPLQGPAYLILKGSPPIELILDNMLLKNVIVMNANLEYDGGPLILENVYFVNCKFDIKRTARGIDVAGAILDHVPAVFDHS